jgi:hypothetical protein
MAVAMAELRQQLRTAIDAGRSDVVATILAEARQRPQGIALLLQPQVGSP